MKSLVPISRSVIRWLIGGLEEFSLYSLGCSWGRPGNFLSRSREGAELVRERVLKGARATRFVGRLTRAQSSSRAVPEQFPSSSRAVPEQFPSNSRAVPVFSKALHPCVLHASFLRGSASPRENSSLNPLLPCEFPIQNSQYLRWNL